MHLLRLRFKLILFELVLRLLNRWNASHFWSHCFVSFLIRSSSVFESKHKEIGLNDAVILFCNFWIFLESFDDIWYFNLFLFFIIIFCCHCRIKGPNFNVLFFIYLFRFISFEENKVKPFIVWSVVITFDILDIDALTVFHFK